ncbi:hypothetical protein FXO38_23799 [Capsicum annuum]|nr:hypothetical protein FXO38_23799 [Capsicum annuum]KAF3641527.1 hypothetical protein FXO37_22953 [Capsicum annuum]
MITITTTEKESRKEQPLWGYYELELYMTVGELVEILRKGEFSKNDYPCINDPSPTFRENSQSASIQANQVPTPHSMRLRRTAIWARPRECILAANVWSSLCTTM